MIVSLGVVFAAAAAAAVLAAGDIGHDSGWRRYCSEGDPEKRRRASHARRSNLTAPGTVAAGIAENTAAAAAAAAVMAVVVAVMAVMATAEVLVVVVHCLGRVRWHLLTPAG
jgi:hypothetical protein